MKIVYQENKLFFFIGLVAGLILNILFRVGVQELFFYSFIGGAALTFGLCFDGEKSFRLILSSLITAFLLSLPFLSFDWNSLGDLNSQTLSFLLTFPLFFYGVHSLHYSLHHENTLKINYSALFLAFLDSFITIAIAIIYLALVNVFLALTAVVFQAVGLTFLWTMYIYTPDLLFLLNVGIFFVGLSIIKVHQHLLEYGRYFLLKLFYAFLPILAAISLIYVGLYCFNYYRGYGNLIPALFIVLPLSILGLLFVIGYYQDGKDTKSYSMIVQFMVNVYRVSLFFIILMLAYQVWLNTYIYPNLFLYLLVASLLGLLYAITVFMPETMERRVISSGNIYILIFYILMTLILNNPFVPAKIYSNPIKPPSQLLEIQNEINKQVEQLKRLKL